MGIYGMGKAFNLRYANSGQFRATHVKFRQPARPMMGGNFSYTENTNVTIKNGPSGFWGFLGGFFGGLFGGGMFGSSMNMNMGMSMPMGYSPYGMLNTQMAQVKTPDTSSSNQLQNLKTLYPKFNIVADNDKFSATDSDGHLIGKQLSYEDMLSALAKAKESQGEENKEKVENSDPQEAKAEAKANPSARPEKQGSGSLKDINGYTGAMNVHDEVRGSQYDINGKATVSKDTDTDSGYPKTITVKGHRYGFQRMEDGVPIYKSLDGAGDEYRLEKGANGKFALNQYEGDKGAGTADISTRRAGTSQGASEASEETEISSAADSTTTIDPAEIKKDPMGGYSYTYTKVPMKPITVNLTMFEAQGLTQAQIQEKLQEKLNAQLE